MSALISIPPQALPILTTLIGLGGLTVGIHSFTNPLSAARIYGVPTNSTSVLTSTLFPSAPTTTSSSSSTSTSTPGSLPTSTNTNTNTPTPEQNAYIHALGIRNLTTGLSIIALTSYWHITLHNSAPAIRLAVQRALGIVILVFSFVPIVDAWVCWRVSTSIPKSDFRRSDVKGKGGNADRDREAEFNIWAAGIGRRAGMLHALRSLVWIAGGLWCFYG